MATSQILINIEIVNTMKKYNSNSHIVVSMVVIHNSYLEVKKITFHLLFLTVKFLEILKF